MSDQIILSLVLTMESKERFKTSFILNFDFSLDFHFLLSLLYNFQLCVFCYICGMTEMRKYTKRISFFYEFIYEGKTNTFKSLEQELSSIQISN